LNHKNELDSNGKTRQNALVKRKNPSPSRPGEKFTNIEVAQIWKEIGLRGWRPRDFYDAFQRKNQHLFKESPSTDNIEKVISKSEHRRIKAQAYHRAALANTFGWEIEEFSELLRGNRPGKKATGADRAPLRFPFFREIRIVPYQEIGSEERPWPFPPPGSCVMPPFPPKAETHYVSACNVRLNALARYDLKPLIQPNPKWSEIEIVLYQCVPLPSAVDGLWKRMASFGAVSSGNGPSKIIPEGENWLVTCWGKHRIARDEPWWPFVPIDCTLDKTRRKLTTSFAPTAAQHDALAVLELLADSQGSR